MEITFTLPTLPSNDMAKDEQKELLLMQATAMIVVAYLEVQEKLPEVVIKSLHNVTNQITEFDDPSSGLTPKYKKVNEAYTKLEGTFEAIIDTPERLVVLINLVQRALDNVK